MPLMTWAHLNGRPRVVADVGLPGDPMLVLNLLADSGAGNTQSSFELIMLEANCRALGGQEEAAIALTGAYVGTFPVFTLRLQIPALGFDEDVPVVGVPTVPDGFAGIACFRFLNRFGYGNFNDPALFGLES